ncbi:cryptochrome/photolyase family protein [Galbitalea soli]|uniref:Deoxyribodipyrimidine photo-lyase n=1 Tax=Galbitalea soli TaxID=1268042 RepID=A0A7C9PMV8_9MICO|nr:deoxyribodipyrimidine photo-lyase [Galbitalea soli]NEM90988.1 deoxyribodipyrimidine photo-lyase [Galbitalea soli]NYJ29675.1 deoxyribodipyrimidine photo-lyase [Galbitalea soli]
MASQPTIVWLRDDLRLADNPALQAAIETGAPLVVVYVLDEESDGIRPLGGATRWWLHHSLAALGAEIARVGGELVLRSGPAGVVIPALVDEVDAGAVHWNRRYGAARQLDADLKSSLRARGIDVHSHQGNLLSEPWTVTTGEGNPYRVFTPFWKACLDRGEPREPLAEPTALDGLRGVPSETLDSWRLLPVAPDWSGGIAERWTPGERSARGALEEFATGALAQYDRRDEPALDPTSHLSPHLRFGEISPFQVWHRIRGALGAPAARNADKFLRQLVWREFNWNILFHWPDLAETNFRPEFDAFPWRTPAPGELEAWQEGRTGIPLVDAGMRELWATGYMHNRVRLVAGSFLVKNLLLDWRLGERWFWDTLVDADEANNPGNWQWVAGSGADAAPYFRVFNPALQQSRFDPEGAYVSRWVPDDELRSAPIVDLAETRAAALAAYDELKRRNAEKAEAATTDDRPAR